MKAHTYHDRRLGRDVTIYASTGFVAGCADKAAPCPGVATVRTLIFFPLDSTGRACMSPVFEPTVFSLN